MHRLDDSINMDLTVCVMLGHDLQIMTLTQGNGRHCEPGNVYLVAQKTGNFYPFVQLIT